MTDRRKFLQKSALAGAALFISTKVSVGAAAEVNLEEATVSGLQAAMASGQTRRGGSRKAISRASHRLIKRPIR